MSSAPFTPEALADYLGRVHGGAVRNVRVTPLGGGRQGDKGYGYGVPLRLDYELDGKPQRAVLETVRAGPFGHEHMADRAQNLLWAHHAFASLPRHVASLDVGAVQTDGALIPLGNADEFFMVASFIDGKEYADDLLRLRAGAADCRPGSRESRRVVRLPRGNPSRAGPGPRPLRAPHPRDRWSRRVPLRRFGQLPGRVCRCAAEDRASRARRGAGS